MAQEILPRDAGTALVYTETGVADVQFVTSASADPSGQYWAATRLDLPPMALGLVVLESASAAVDVRIYDELGADLLDGRGAARTAGRFYPSYLPLGQVRRAVVLAGPVTIAVRSSSGSVSGRLVLWMTPLTPQPRAPEGPTGGMFDFTLHAAAGADLTWTNMPLAATFLAGSPRHRWAADLRAVTQVQLVVNKRGTSGAAAAKLQVRYYTGNSETASDYLAIGVGGDVSVAVNTTNTLLLSGWYDVVDAARISPCYLAVIGTGGDGVIDPLFGGIRVQFR